MVELIKLITLFSMVAGIAILLPFHFYAIKKCSDWLKDNDVESWEEVGRFSLFKNNSISSSFKFSKWVFANKYSEIEDKRIVRYFGFIKFCIIYGYVFLFVMIALPFL